MYIELDSGCFCQKCFLFSLQLINYSAQSEIRFSRYMLGYLSFNETFVCLFVLIESCSAGKWSILCLPLRSTARTAKHKCIVILTKVINRQQNENTTQYVHTLVCSPGAIFLDVCLIQFKQNLLQLFIFPKLSWQRNTWHKNRKEQVSGFLKMVLRSGQPAWQFSKKIHRSSFNQPQTFC